MGSLDRCRIAWRSLLRGEVRSAYHDWAQYRRDRRLLDGQPDEFRLAVNGSGFYSGRPQRRSTEGHLEEGVAWLGRAQNATRDDGFSLGYFPLRAPESTDEGNAGWLPSYPETTGYIIPTLLDYARRNGVEDARVRALRAADWEISVQMANGAVQGGPVCESGKQVPAVFNTGQVIFGWLAAYETTKEHRFLEAAIRAGSFLLECMDQNGEYVRGLSTFAAPGVQTYNSRCSWALYELGRVTGDDRLRVAAIRNVDRVVSAHALPNGWYTDNDLSDRERPLVHTIAYTMQGILEVGIAEQRDDVIQIVHRGATLLGQKIRPDGFLAGCWYRDWRPAVTWSCLTGSAQLAIILFRLAALGIGTDHRERAERLLEFCRNCQRLDLNFDEGRGALAGSNPILGSYMRGGYPNWATKFLVDALMRSQDHALDNYQGFEYHAG